MTAITVGTARAERGERCYGVIWVADLALGIPVQVPVAVINGKHRGPRLYLAAGVHGDELNGIEVLRRVLPAVDPEHLRGSIVAVTVTNPPAFQNRNRNAPQDKEDMNRLWPGKPHGKLADRIAHKIFTEAVEGADLVVDLHTAATNMVVHVVYAEGDGASRELALAFGTEVVLEERRDERWEEAGFGGKLRSVMNNRGIPSITPELGRAGVFQEGPVKMGVQGIFGVLAHAAMLDGCTPPERHVVTLTGSHLDSITASRAGLFVSQTRPGEILDEGDRIGYLYRVTDFVWTEEFLAPNRGMVLSIIDNPVVDTGSYVAGLCAIRQEQGFPSR